MRRLATLPLVLLVFPAGGLFTLTGGGQRAPRDGEPAAFAGLGERAALAGLPDGSFLVGDGSAVWRVDRQGIIRPVAGNDELGDSGDGGPALEAELRRRPPNWWRTRWTWGTTPTTAGASAPRRVDCQVFEDVACSAMVSVSFVRDRLRWGTCPCSRGGPIFPPHPRYSRRPRPLRPGDWRQCVSGCPPALFGRVDETALIPSN